MKPNNTKIKTAQSEAVMDIVCGQWEVGEAFDVSIRQEWAPDVYSLPPAAIIFPGGFRPANMKTIAECSLIVSLRKELPC